MAILGRISITGKILILLGLSGLVALSVALLGYFSFARVDASYSELVDKRMPANTQMARLGRAVTAMPYSAYQAIAYEPASEAARRTVQEEQASYEAAMASLKDIRELGAVPAELVGTAERAITQAHDASRRAVSYALASRDDEARREIAAADQAVDLLESTLVPFLDKEVEETEAASAALSSDTSSTSNLNLIIAVVMTLAGLVFGFLMTRASITGPLAGLDAVMGRLASGDTSQQVVGTERADEVGKMAKAVLVFRDALIEQQRLAEAKRKSDAEQQAVVDTVGRHLGQLAQGDLTAEIAAEFPPAYAAVRDNFNEALRSLRSLIGSVAESARQIRTGSGEIAQSAEDLARRTESNASSLEETSAAVTEMSGRLAATAQAAGQTVERADQAIGTVTGGREIADEAVQAMNRVSDSAKGIDDVIEGLDKIAFQTRVLAMNAAVEAGRAGEAGRGFAVVADLVSALAMRAEEEAKRARDQLTVTQTDIVAAVDAVHRVDDALSNISADVGEVHKLLATMAADNQAQASAITQINAAVSSMDQATQQNAAMVEETSAAARNLTAEVTAMAEQASQFRTDAGGGVARSSAQRVKPLPAAAVKALTRPLDQETWQAF